MQRASSSTLKTLNVIGKAFKDAKPAKQLMFKAALLEAGETDSVNYWRTFRDVWKYSEQVGKAPFMIVALAKQILDVEPDNLLKK